uniref:Cilia and flagella associated protein 77 n=1 Tax=Erpetoichthys calabaricus TaxID=27687 RepID=A0A8C4S6D6_ERPCA
MEPARIGVVRESMLSNPLLMRNELGKSGKRGFRMPGPDFVYGKPYIVRDGGVPEVLTKWNYVTSAPRPGSGGQKALQDFVSLNREAVKSGLVTAQEHYHYRALHDYKYNPVKVGPWMKHQRLPADMTFGLPSQVGDPIYSLMEHRYQHDWLKEQLASQEARQAKQQMKKAKQQKIKETRTTHLRKSLPGEEQTTFWQMPRFQKVGPHLSTFRDPEERRKAFLAHSSDSTTRFGYLGQGIHTIS